MTSVNPAVAILNEQLSKGNVVPRIERYVHSEFRNFSPYDELLIREGANAAEKSLEDSIKKCFVREFAGAVLTTVVAMRDIAVDDSSQQTVFIQSMKETKFSRYQDKSGILIGINNQYFSGPAPGIQAFGRDHRLGLRMILIGLPEENLPSVSLIFSLKNEKIGYTMVTFDVEGRMRMDTVQVRLNNANYLDYVLHAHPLENALMDSSVHGGDMDSHMFPGAFDHLGKHIGDLGPYLLEMVKHTRD